MLVRKIVVLTDIKWENSTPMCIVHRYDPTSTAKEPLTVTLAATEPPSGYESIGGVAYVLNQPGYTKLDPYPAEFSEQGDRLTWTEDVLAGLMLIVVLPAGYILHHVDDAEPQLSVCRVIKGQMAVCWFETQNSDKIKFSFHLEKAQMTITELRTHCSSLNKEAAERPREENLPIPEPVKPVKNPHIENSFPPTKSTSVRDKLLVLITYCIFILGALITIGGFILIFRGPSASTTVQILGQSLTTTNVGVVTLFLGIVMILITIKGVFSVLQNGSSSDSPRKKRRIKQDS
jgi:hypothetical protein